MRAFALGRSRACAADTLRPLSPFFAGPLFKARGEEPLRFTVATSRLYNVDVKLHARAR